MNRRIIHGKRRRGRAGFTLLEILVASMIVAMLMLIIGRIFVDANRVYELGTKDMDINAEARAVLEFMAQELAAAVAETNGPLTLCITKDIRSEFYADELMFISLDGEPAYHSPANIPREAVQVRYMAILDSDGIPNLRRLSTMNDYLTACYKRDDWWNYNEMPGIQRVKGFTAGMNLNYRSLMNNVFQLKFHYMVYDGSGFYEVDEIGHGDGGRGANSLQDEYPDFIDITLGVMSENDIKRWALLYDPGDDTAQKEYEERFGKVFRARVFLHSAYGYDMMTR
jgi:prepilin-type N-terminal cleavage/methylation domain-containing protein